VLLRFDSEVSEFLSILKTKRAMFMVGFKRLSRILLKRIRRSRPFGIKMVDVKEEFEKVLHPYA
jgi:hypothetical protein